jgi:glycosyltransferase involved in cell wall biosynthesis
VEVRRKVRIAINAMVLGPHDTGVGIWTRGLIRALARVDLRNQYVVYHRSAAGVIAPEAGRNFEFRQVACGTGRLRRIMWEQFVLPRVLKQDRIDVVHCPAYVMPHRAETPAVLTVHDLFAFTHPHLCRRANILHFRMMVPKSIRRATLIHCMSHWTRGVICDIFPDAIRKLRVIHPGVDTRFEVPDSSAVSEFRRRYGLDAPPFLFVGNVEPKKNVPLILDALAELKAKHGLRRKLLVVGGRGWGEKVAEQISRLGLEGDVVRAGYLLRDTLPVAYGAALALIFPSEVEGFGLPPLEAMACGTPVVTTNRGGLPEAVGCAAVIVRDRTPEALAQTMHEVEESEGLRHSLTVLGLQRVRHFDWNITARRFVELYAECAERTLAS